MHKKLIAAFLAVFTACAILSSIFFIHLIPANSVCMVKQVDSFRAYSTFIENKTSDNIILFRFFLARQNYPSSRVFTNSFYSAAPNRAEKILKNQVSYRVYFPTKKFNSADTLSVFSLIYANAFIALQQASADIGQDFYTTKGGQDFNQLFEKYLRESKICQSHPILKTLYFTDGSIERIDYVNSKTMEEIKNKNLDFNMFVSNHRLYFDYRDKSEIKNLCLSFRQELSDFNSN